MKKSTSGNNGFDRDDGSCKECNGYAIERKGKFGQFIRCSNFPVCENSSPTEKRDIRTYLLLSGDDIDRAIYEAYYNGDAR